MPKTIWVELLGAEMKIIQGKRYRSRIVEAGREHPETLVLTHPGGGHVETFARNIVPLGEHIHTVGMEMLWHGLSGTPPIQDDGVAQEAEQVVDLLDAMEVDRAWVHGNASGGVVPTWLAINRPDRLMGIIYEATRGGVAVKTDRPPPPPPTSASGLSIAEQTLQLLKDPTWDGVRGDGHTLAARSILPDRKFRDPNIGGTSPPPSPSPVQGQGRHSPPCGGGLGRGS